MKHLAPAPAHAIGPKLGEMSRKRAFEINGWLVDLYFWLEALFDSPEGPARIAHEALREIDLDEMLEATRIVAADPGERDLAGNTVMTCFCADRAVAAIYCHLNGAKYYGRARAAA